MRTASTETAKMDEQIAHFVQCVRGRNVRETVAAVLLIVLFGIQLFMDSHSTLGKVDCIVFMDAAIVFVFVLWGSLHIPSTELQTYPPAQNKEYWKRRLTTQAQGLRLAWLWHVLALFSGIVLAICGHS